MASVVSNTSLTIKDVLNLTIVEFEELLEGMNEYSDEIDKQIQGKDTNRLEGREGIDFLLSKFGKK